MKEELIKEIKDSITKIADFAYAIMIDDSRQIASTMSDEIRRYCMEAMEILNHIS